MNNILMKLSAALLTLTAPVLVGEANATPAQQEKVAQTEMAEPVFGNAKMNTALKDYKLLLSQYAAISSKATKDQRERFDAEHNRLSNSLLKLIPSLNAAEQQSYSDYISYLGNKYKIAEGDEDDHEGHDH